MKDAAIDGLMTDAFAEDVLRHVQEKTMPQDRLQELLPSTALSLLRASPRS